SGTTGCTSTPGTAGRLTPSPAPAAAAQGRAEWKAAVPEGEETLTASFEILTASPREIRTPFRKVRATQVRRSLSGHSFRATDYSAGGYGRVATLYWDPNDRSEVWEKLIEFKPPARDDP